MWLGNLVFVLFVLLGVSKDFIYFYLLENLKQVVASVTAETRRTLDEPSTDLCHQQNILFCLFSQLAALTFNLSITYHQIPSKLTFGTTDADLLALLTS